MIYSDSFISRMIRRSFDLRPRPWSDPDTQCPRGNPQSEIRNPQSLIDLLFVLGLVFFLSLGFWMIVNSFSGPGRTGQYGELPTPTGQSPAEGGPR